MIHNLINIWFKRDDNGMITMWRTLEVLRSVGEHNYNFTFGFMVVSSP